MAQLTLADGDVPTAAQLNTYALGEGNAWTSWTPAVVQSGSVSVTVNRAKYARYGRTILGDAYVTCTSTGTSSNNLTITTPTTMASSSGNTIVGEAWLFDSSASFFYFGQLMWVTSTTCAILRRIDGAAASYLGSAGFTAALASGDVLSIKFAYESAT